jgi:hypothetical protein
MIHDRYAVILVQSTSHAIRGEQLLHRAGIPAKLIPVPRHLSSDCGVCLRIEREHIEAACKRLEAAAMEVDGLHEI